MGRSIKLTYKTYDNGEWKDGDAVQVPLGLNTAEINLPCEEIQENENGELIKGNIVQYITVEIDGQKNNETFKVETYNQWFDYSIERGREGERDGNIVLKEEYVRIKLIIPKNLDTAYRYGGLIIKHNSSPLIAYIELNQEPTVYSLEVTYDKNDETKGIFRSIPWMNENGDIIGDGSSVYQEKRINVIANGGSQEWYLKDIEQYEAYSNLKDEAISDDPIKKIDIKEDIRVPYDGALSYYLKNKCSQCGELFTEDICPKCKCSDFVSLDKSGFYIKSYGKIDMSGRHMRYFFRICHKDVNNRNKKYLDSDNNPYEVRKLFIFDKGLGRGYEEGEPTVTPEEIIESKIYTFLVNKKKDQTISCNASGGGFDAIVTSTCQGHNVGFTTSGGDFATFTNDKITIDENKGSTTRNSTIIFTQNESGKTITVKIIQTGEGQDTVFTVNGNSSDFKKDFSNSSANTNFTVVSTKNGQEIPYTVFKNDDSSWLDIVVNGNSVIAKINENFDTENRTAVLTFKQNDTGKEINVTINQSGCSSAKYGYTIHYYFVNTETSIRADYVSGKIFDEGYVVEVSAVNIDGYNVFGTETQSIVITRNESNNVAIFYYSKDEGERERETYYTVNFITDEGEVLSESYKVSHKNVGYIVKDDDIEKPSFGEYTYDRIDAVNGWVLLEDGTKNVFNVIYSKNVVKNTITIKAGNNVQSDCRFELYVIKMVDGDVLPEEKIGEVSFSKPTDSKNFEVEEGEEYSIYYVGGEGDTPLKVTHKIAASMSYEMGRVVGESKKINSSDGEVITIDVVKEESYNTVIIRSSGSTNASNGYGFTVLWRDEVMDEFYFDEPYQSITLKLIPNDNSYRMIYREGVGESIVEINSKTRSKVTKCYRSEGEVYFINNVDGEEITLTPNPSSKVYGCVGRQSDNGTNYYCLYGPNGVYDIVGTFRYPNTGNETTISQRIKLNSLTLPDTEYGYDYYVGKGAVINTICDERRGQPGYVGELTITPVK